MSLCLHRRGGVRGVLPSLPGHGAQPTGRQPGLHTVWRHTERDVHHPRLHRLHHWQGHPQHNPAGKWNFTFTFFFFLPMAVLFHISLPCVHFQLSTSILSAAASSERWGVPAGGWSLPGWEEAGGSRREPVLAVCQSSLGDELPVESWESHGGGELLQGEHTVLMNVVMGYRFGPDILWLCEAV